MNSKSSHKTILFLDSENYDLARTAEILFNGIASKMGLPWRSVSRGLTAKQPTKKEGPMPPDRIKELKLRGHRSPDLERVPIQVAREDVDAANRIVLLNLDQREPQLYELLTSASAEIQSWEFDDKSPTLEAIDHHIGNLIARLLGGTESAASSAEPPASKPAKAPIVKVGRETKGRRGKGVTLISEVPLSADKLQELATLLKGRCGTGGTVKDGVIEIQGDQRDRITTELEKLGYRVKRAGG